MTTNDDNHNDDGVELALEASPDGGLLVPADLEQPSAPLEQYPKEEDNKEDNKEEENKEDNKEDDDVEQDPGNAPVEADEISEAAAAAVEACFTEHGIDASAARKIRFYQWLYDRCDGSSKYNPQFGRPPCFICYVPLPVRWLADYIEMNAVFEAIGRVGCVDPECPRIRVWLFGCALVCNVTSFLLTAFAILAATLENYDLLRVTSFTRGTWEIDTDRGIDFPGSQADMGLRGVAVTDATFAPNSTILTFSEFCNDIVKPAFELGQGEVFVTAEQCQTCDDASFPIVFSLIISLVFIWPTVTTNFLRMYPNYDVNCQKFFGAVVGIISLLSSCYSWFGYTNACFNNFHQGSEIHFANLTVVPDKTIVTPENEHEFLFTHTDWDAGWGLIAVVAATLLKALDAIFNWVVPTPSITRDHAEQRDYQYLHYHQRTPSIFEKVHQKHRREESFHGGVVLLNAKTHSVRGGITSPHKQQQQQQQTTPADGEEQMGETKQPDVSMDNNDDEEQVSSSLEPPQTAAAEH